MTVPLLDNTGYSASLIRFWRVPSHREGLEVLAEASSQSSEADYLEHEWAKIRDGNRAEFELRRSWALSPEAAAGDLIGWKYAAHPAPLWIEREQKWHEVLTWDQIVHAFGPPHARHRACLCQWLYDKPYPAKVTGGGGMGDAGGRARRIIADLDWARDHAPCGLTEYELERYMSIALGRRVACD